MIQDSTIPSAVINISYHAGSKDEKIGIRGYAHLFEHLMFEGSKHIPAGMYDKLSLNAGCENNAYTTADKTVYYIQFPIHQLEFAMWLESDRMLEFSITQEALETQKNVVLEEKKQLFDNRPYGSVTTELHPLLFKNNSYGWDTIGDENDLKNASLEKLKEFFESCYTPDNAVLTIAGDIDFDYTLNLAEKYFGSINRKSIAAVNKFIFNDEPISKEIHKTITDNIQLPGIFIAYKIPKENSFEFLVLEVISDILSTGDSSRLYSELVYNKQLVNETGCFALGREFSGIFHLYSILEPNIKIKTVQQEIDKIIYEIADGKTTEKELQKVKNRIETRIEYRFETNLSKSEILSHFQLLYNKPELSEELIEKYKSITLTDIKETAEKYLINNGRVVLKYIPKNGNYTGK